MDRCWLKGATGDALHALLCAIGYNLRWLLRAIARLNLSPAFLRRLFSAFCRQMEAAYPLNQLPTPGFKGKYAGI
jgi:hypothetical protein